VWTYTQSANFVFGADPKLAESIPSRVTSAIAEPFGLDVQVVNRTAGQMRVVVGNNPFLAAGAPEDALHVLAPAYLPWDNFPLVTIWYAA
jgi:uncharacterized protein (DUF1697 family)